MMHNRLTVISASTAWNTVARFDDYEAAQLTGAWIGLLPEPAA